MLSGFSGFIPLSISWCPHVPELQNNPRRKAWGLRFWFVLRSLSKGLAEGDCSVSPDQSFKLLYFLTIEWEV